MNVQVKKVTTMGAVATEDQFWACVREQAALLGIAHPWKVEVQFRSPVDPTDANCYAACESQPEYYVIRVFVDPGHSGWVEKEGGKIEEALRHELLHGMVSVYTALVNQLFGEGNKDMEKVLNHLEERLVSWLSTMPVWEKGRD
jgi:hypothetical protein